MNKVITINLNGNAVPLEEDGYETLRSYLDTAARRLEGNPDKEEIIADIEQAIAEKFRAHLSAYKTVVVTKEVESVIAEMGPVQDPSSPEEQPAGNAGVPPLDPDRGGSSRPADAEPAAPPPPRRLHKIKEGAMIGGVCNGLAAYFGIDVTLVRIAFVLLLLVYGTGVLAYIVMMIIFPTAVTPAEKAAASGGAGAHTAQEFIRRAKEGYYEGAKTFGDKKARREWKRKFKDEMRGWKRDFKREMKENTSRWGQNWGQYWAQPPQHGLAACIAFPFLVIVRVLLALLAVFAVFSLICTGAIFGLFLPFTAPLWVGIIFLIIIYKILVWPLKAMRHSYYFNGPFGPRYAEPFHGLTESCVWLAVVVLVLWMLSHHRAEVHETLHHFPRAMRHAADSVRDWWDDR